MFDRCGFLFETFHVVPLICAVIIGTIFINIFSLLSSSSSVSLPGSVSLVFKLLLLLA